MSEAQTTISVTLELRLEGDALSGSANDGTGVERPFTGWIGLAAVIEELLERGDHDAAAE